MKQLPIFLAALVVLIATLFTQPQTFWQGEEVRFAQSLLTFDPVQQQPESPGYPLYVAIGRLLNFFLRQPFRTLIVLSVVATVAGVSLTGLAATRLLGDEWLGAAAAIFLFGSPAMLVFAPLPNAQAAGVACVAAGMLWGGVFAAAAIGVVPQTALPMLIFGVRRRAAAFFITLALICIPFLAANPRAYLHPSETVAGVHGRELVLRFLAHPWGPKSLSFPLLILAAIGLFGLIRRARARAAPLIAFAAIYIAFALAFFDRSQGVEPVIPALIAFAIWAAAAFWRWPRAAFAVAIVYAIAGFAYAWPLLQLRRTTLSPPARAMRYVRETVPDNAVLVCDPAMEPWGRLSRFEVHSLADFDLFANRGDVPLVMLADGGSHVPRAAEFSWPASDIYGKLTTRRYRVVSIIPFPPPTRYRSLAGVYAFERTADGREWRWLARDATIALPPLGSRVVHLRLGLPDDAPVASNMIAINGTSVNVTRGQAVDVAFASAPILKFHAAQAFSSDRDRRNLAVQLIALEQR